MLSPGSLKLSTNLEGTMVLNAGKIVNEQHFHVCVSLVQVGEGGGEGQEAMASSVDLCGQYENCCGSSESGREQVMKGLTKLSKLFILVEVSATRQ